MNIEFDKKHLDLLNIPVVITDYRGIIGYSNPAQSKLTGFSFAEIIDSRPGDLWGGQMPASYYSKMWETIGSGKEYRDVVVNQKKSGERYLDQLSITPIITTDYNKYYIQSLVPNLKEYLSKLENNDFERLFNDSRVEFKDRYEDSTLLNLSKDNLNNYSKLYQKYYQKLKNYILPRVKYDNFVAEDISQETFSRAIRYVNNYSQANSSYFTYLVKIAHTVLARWYDTQNKTLLMEDEDLDMIADKSREYAEIKSDIENSLASLNQLESQILKMYYIEGYSVHEIAILLNKSPNAIKLHMSRARKKAKNTLD